MCAKPSSDSVKSNGSDSAFIGTILTAFSGERSNLNIKFLHDPLYFLVVYNVSLFAKFAIHTPVTIVFVFSWISKILFSNSWSGFSLSNLFCQYMYVALGISITARMSFSLNSPRRL